MDLWLVSAADPDLKLRGEGIVLIAPPVFRPSVITYIFTQNKGGRGADGPPGSRRASLPKNLHCIWK